MLLLYIAYEELTLPYFSPFLFVLLLYIAYEELTQLHLLLICCCCLLYIAYEELTPHVYRFPKFFYFQRKLYIAYEELISYVYTGIRATARKLF